MEILRATKEIMASPLFKNCICPVSNQASTLYNQYKQNGKKINMDIVILFFCKMWFDTYN